MTCFQECVHQLKQRFGERNFPDMVITVYQNAFHGSSTSVIETAMKKLLTECQFANEITLQRVKEAIRIAKGETASDWNVNASRIDYRCKACHGQGVVYGIRLSGKLEGNKKAFGCPEGCTRYSYLKKWEWPQDYKLADCHEEYEIGLGRLPDKPLPTIGDIRRAIGLFLREKVR